MARLSLTLLGGFQAELGAARAVSLPSRKARALLAYLALTPGQAHPRDKLAALLWGDSSDERARHSLRQALVNIRDGLRHAAPKALIEDSDSVALNPEVSDVDADTFRRLATIGTATALEGAARLYRGDLLEGLDVGESSFEDWLLTERERLREVALEVSAKLLAHHSEAGAVDAAIDAGVRLLGLDPAQEPVHRSLMRLYVRKGRRGAALRQYQMCVSALERELGVEPEADTKQLYQDVLRSRSVVHRAPSTRAGTAPTPVNRPMQPRAGETLIGRGAELDQLREALGATENGQGRVVVVLGEAGIGKSSVLQSLVAEAGERGVRVLLGRSYESEQVLPFGPWLDAFRSGGVGHDAAPLERLSPVWRAELAALLPEVESEPVPPSQDRARLFESVAQLVAALSTRGALMVALEDLHWADEMSLHLLSFLGRRAQVWPVLFVVTAREEEIPDRPSLRVALEELQRESHVSPLTLSPLSRESIASLVRSLVRVRHDAAVAARLEENVWRVSEGNPFVAAEIVRALRDGTMPEMSAALPLPQRVRQVTAGRLERLSDRGRRLTAVAAVIGREFEFALLQRAAGLNEPDAADGVEELVRRRVLRGVGERFDFVHDRIREVAGGEVLPPRRRLLHAAIGGALEALYAENLEPHYAALATHCREGETWDKAAVYCRHAGVQAGARSALVEARTWLEQALQAVEKLPESRSKLEQAVDIRFDLRPVLAQLVDYSSGMENLCEAEALAGKLKDDRRCGRVAAYMTNMHLRLGQLAEARASGIRALTIGRTLEDLDLRVLSTTFLGQVHHYYGEYEQQVDLITRNVANLPAEWVYKDFGIGVPISVFDRAQLMMSLAHLGRFAEAAQYEAQGIGLAQPMDHPFTVAQAYMPASFFRVLKGDWEKARALAERAIAALRTRGVGVLLTTSMTCSVWARAQLGETSGILDPMREAEQRLEDVDARHPVSRPRGATHGWDYHALGRAWLLLGRLDDARRLSDRAIESSPPGSAGYAWHLRGDIVTNGDRLDAESGETHYRQALALAEPRRMGPLVAHCHFGLGRLYQRTGKRQEAREHLSTATSMYREMDMAFWLEQASA
jgi:DNA-binding SARP family transcriptional activator